MVSRHSYCFTELHCHLPHTLHSRRLPLRPVWPSRLAWIRNRHPPRCLVAATFLVRFVSRMFNSHQIRVDASECPESRISDGCEGREWSSISNSRRKKSKILQGQHRVRSTIYSYSCSLLCLFTCGQLVDIVALLQLSTISL